MEWVFTAHAYREVLFYDDLRIAVASWPTECNDQSPRTQLYQGALSAAGWHSLVVPCIKLVRLASIQGTSNYWTVSFVRLPVSSVGNECCERAFVCQWNQVLMLEITGWLFRLLKTYRGSYMGPLF